MCEGICYVQSEILRQSKLEVRLPAGDWLAKKASRSFIKDVAQIPRQEKADVTHVRTANCQDRTSTSAGAVSARGDVIGAHKDQRQKCLIAQSTPDVVHSPQIGQLTPGFPEHGESAKCGDALDYSPGLVIESREPTQRSDSFRKSTTIGGSCRMHA